MRSSTETRLAPLTDGDRYLLGTLFLQGETEFHIVHGQAAIKLKLLRSRGIERSVRSGSGPKWAYRITRSGIDRLRAEPWSARKAAEYRAFRHRLLLNDFSAFKKRDEVIDLLRRFGVTREMALAIEAKLFEPTGPIGRHLDERELDPGEK